MALASLACAGTRASIDASTEEGAIQAWTMRERLEQVSAGQTRERAQAILGEAPVRKPGHPEDPFPSPRRTLKLPAEAGQDVRVELYVVSAHRAEGCPDVQFEDVPVVFRDEAVAGTGWDFLEEHWRGWGGSLARLRDARDRSRCASPGEDPAS